MSECEGKLKILALPCELKTVPRSAESSASGRAVWLGLRWTLGTFSFGF